MRSLNSICRARDEARYISRTWSNTKDAVQQDQPNKITEVWTKADTAKWGSIDAYNEWYSANERRKEAKIANLIKYAQALNELPERKRCGPLFGQFKSCHDTIRALMSAEPGRFNAKVLFELDNFEELFV